jgi:hypothetical protein
MILAVNNSGKSLHTSVFGGSQHGYLNKIKKTCQRPPQFIKGSTLEIHYPQELKSPLSDQNLLSKSASKCEVCGAKFTS